MSAHDERLAFIGTHILPHEAGMRQWLAHAGLSASECDDLVQEVYYRLLRQTSYTHITDPRAYLYRTARNLMFEQIRKNRVVSITAVQNLDELGRADIAPSPEEAVSARRELVRVLAFIEALPTRCKAVFEMRKVHGLSQAETAARLGISENVVEKETGRGLSLILKRLAEGEAVPPPQTKPARIRHVRH